MLAIRLQQNHTCLFMHKSLVQLFILNFIAMLIFLVRMENFCFSYRRRQRLFGFHCKSNAPELQKTAEYLSESKLRINRNLLVLH